MYAALWRALPGGRWVKAGESLLLALAVVTVLFLWVFPLVTPYLPFENVTVQSPSSTSSPSSTQTPSIPAASPSTGATP
ncbi:MAG: hypothetical protein ABI083_10775 [Lapillicoccus sp.]